MVGGQLVLRKLHLFQRIPPTGTKSNGSGAGVGNSVIGKSWFYGDIDRTAAVNILKARASVGEFLVRNCSVSII